MNIVFFVLVIVGVLLAVGLPVRLALRRGSWRAAVVAALVALALPSLAFWYFGFVTNDFDMGVIGVAYGVPLIALGTSAALLFAISKLIPARTERQKAD
jgi:hypothetical protein